MSEAAISGLNARLNNTIMKWAQEYHGLLRRLEKNRFILVFEKRDLKQAMDSKFSVLENIHEITSPAGLAASISIGLGVDGATFEEGYEFDAVVLDDSVLAHPQELTLAERMERAVYLGLDEKSVSHKFVAGAKII
jgi:c-di-AMP phosphodiesterase-like protein